MGQEIPDAYLPFIFLFFPFLLVLRWQFRIPGISVGRGGLYGTPSCPFQDRGASGSAQTSHRAS